MTHEFVLVESDLNVRTIGVRLRGVLVEQDGKVRVVGVCSEAIRDVRDMIAGFLKHNCMELLTGSRRQYW